MVTSMEFLNYVLEQIAPLPDLRSRRMFGGVGLYCADVFFGIVSNDILYFKVAEDDRAGYEARGMRPFRPYSGRPQVRLTYFEVPADVLEDGDQCAAWARRAVAAAMVTRSERSARTGKRLR